MIAARSRAAVALLLAVAACTQTVPPPDDGGTDPGPVDGMTGVDVAPTALAVNFTASGCTTGDGEGRQCQGPTPLTVTFVPLVTGALTDFLWVFGDTSQSAERNPVHTFALPGRYDVTLVAQGPFGSVSHTVPQFVIANMNPAGHPCDVDAQCEPDLSCVCGSTASCSAAFTRGMCGRACGDDGCEPPTVCADLSLSGSVSSETPWRQPLCLPPCETDGDCPAPLRCRDLPSRFPPGQWVRACFADEPGPIGAPCRTAAGQINHQACVTGLCTDLGAHGLCSQDCETAACPAGTGCALLTDGDRRCVPLCSESFPCTNDALLECQASGTPGPRGFTVPGAAAEDRFCMPRPCTGDDTCGPVGQCLMDNDLGHCTRP